MSDRGGGGYGFFRDPGWQTAAFWPCPHMSLLCARQCPCGQTPSFRKDTGQRGSGLIPAASVFIAAGKVLALNMVKFRRSGVKRPLTYKFGGRWGRHGSARNGSMMLEQETKLGRPRRCRAWHGGGVCRRNKDTVPRAGEAESLLISWSRSAVSVDITYDLCHQDVK